MRFALSRSAAVRATRAATLALLLLGAACETQRPPRFDPDSIGQSLAAADAGGPVVEPAAPEASAAPSASSASPEAAATPTPLPKVTPATPAPKSPRVALVPGGRDAVSGDGGLVTSVEPNATRAGLEVLRRGGNAIDAAVAVAFALAVTHPSAGNLGGGGFMIVRLANGEAHAIDFRETAPAAATADGIRAMVQSGGLGWASAPVPGSVAGLVYARDKYGSRPLAELVAPAIDLARHGHHLGPRQGAVIGWSWAKLSMDPTARAVFGPHGHPLAEGDLVTQPDLARTLDAIAREGAKGFYEGPIAARIEKEMAAHGGLVTAADLGAYRVKEREPLRFAYRDLEVVTMPPPSMGGIALAEILLAMDRARAWEAPVDSGLGHHLFLEAARRAYADRRSVGADPDFQPPDVHRALVAKLTDGAFLEARKPTIDRAHATPSTEIALAQGAPAGATASAESPQTTHFSVVDAMGNAVSCTTTLSASFGSKVMVPGTGVLFSNALAGFTDGGPNAVAAGKRMASSMTPTVVTQDQKLVLVLGSPGGDTIPNTVAQVFRNLVDWRMPVDQAVAHGRIHHQYLPDRVRMEKRTPLPKGAVAALAKLGHDVEPEGTPIGHANSILVDAATGMAYGVADAREGGKADAIRKHGDAGAKKKRTKKR
jgi:gamma-glutamyltranspeptidase/glutathione hydrolase